MNPRIVICVAILGALLAPPAGAAVAPARNVAPLATITASAASEGSAAGAVADGKVPAAGSRDDNGQVWLVKGSSVPAALTFTWKEAVPVAAVVYYERTTWGFEYFKEYEITVDDAAEPAARGTFRKGHGPQVVTLPHPVTARKLALKFLSFEGGNPGAAEVQIFTAPPPPSALLCRFTTFEMDFRYAYYPSYNMVRVLVPQPPADAKEWQLAVRPAGKSSVLAQRRGTLPMSAAGENLKVPDLPDGHYTLTLTLAGGAEPVVEERGFQRHHYDWEGKKLGLDDVVVPPFTPLKVNAARRTVDAVLRTYTMNGVGLWDQVNSRGEEILAAPMRLEVAAGGKTTAARGSLRISEAKGTRVSGSAAWSAGPLKGRTRFTYDYDGLQQLTLELAKTQQPIERLQLVIPLKAKDAWLMHPVTTGLRHHYAGRVPEGQGKVWDSTQVSQPVGGLFVPYLYVGGPERGICFAADNDRDWVTDPKAPEVEIERTGDTVNLRFNLVARPTVLGRERRITFALQATPAKPMPETPYNWRRWWTTGTGPNVEDVQIHFWGANMYWGGRFFASSVFPAFMDYGFWEELARSRRTGKQDPEYMKQWMERFKDAPADEVASLRAHYGAGLSWAAGTPAITPETKKFRCVIPYINPRGCGPEDRDFLTTYMDEWQTADVADPNWQRYSAFEHNTRINGFGTWYNVEPVHTRADMLLYYHKKMLETFADGIYWDNFFLQPCYVPAEAGGPGYVDDDGKLRPGVNLMAFRRLVRRNAVMMYRMGKRPLTYIHMTNTNIVPMLSFGTMDLDWEWRDQGEQAKQDLQDRLGADQDTGLILAQSLGLKAGNISVAIDRFTPPANSGVTRDWLFRTVMAVCLPHEIKVYQGTQEVSFVQEQLAAFGYGRPECKVYRYWEDGFPLTAEGANTHALVLSRTAKALLAVGNYGPERQQAQPAPAQKEYTVTLKLDLKALGLPEGARAFNVEKNREELARTAPGVFTLPIRHHDFALVAVE